MRTGNAKYLQTAAYIMLILVFVLVIGIARNCGRGSSAPLEGNSGGDTLDIALIYGPSSFYMYGDSLAGINHDIALEFERQTGTPIRFWPVTEPGDALAKLETGTYDILASMPLDNILKERFLTSESVFLDRLVLVQLEDTLKGSPAIKSSLDLDGKKVSVASGSSAANRLDNLAEEIGGKIYIETSPEMSDELLCLQVASGSVPLAVVNERVAQEVAKKYPGLGFNNTVSFTQFQVWVFNSLDTLNCRKFNTWFNSFQSSPIYNQILEKY